MDAKIFAGNELPASSADAAAAPAPAPEVDAGDGAAGGVRSRCRRIGSVVIRRGWAIGKKVVVAGAVGPPVVLLSALGMALSLPFGLYLASLVGTEKLMSCLLPFSPEEDVEDSYPEEQELGFLEESVDHENGGSSSQSSTDYEHSLGVAENRDRLQTMPDDNCAQSTETTQSQIQLVEDEELNLGIEMEKEKVKSKGVLEIGKSNKDDGFDGAFPDKEVSQSTEHPFVDEKLTFATIDDDTIKSNVQEHILFEELYIEEIKGLAEEKAACVIVHGRQSVCVLDEGNDQFVDNPTQLKCMEDETEVDVKEGVERHEQVESIQSDSTGVSQKEAIEKEEKWLEVLKDSSGEITDHGYNDVVEEGMLFDDMHIEDILEPVEKKTEEQKFDVAVHKKLPLEDESWLGTMGDTVRDNEVILEADEEKENEKLTVYIDDSSMDRRIKDCNSVMEARNEAEELQFEGVEGLVEKNTENESTGEAIYDLQPDIHVIEEHDGKFKSTENEDFEGARGYIQTYENFELATECISIGERKEEDVEKEEEHLTSGVIKNDFSDSKLEGDSAVEKGMIFEGMQVKKLGGQELEQNSSSAIHELQPVVYALGQNNQVKNRDGKSSVGVKVHNQSDEGIKKEGSIEKVDYAGGTEVEVTGIEEEAMTAAICGYEKSFVAHAAEEGEVEISLSGLSSEDNTINDLKSGYVNLFQEKQSSIEIRFETKRDIAKRREAMHPNIAESENQDPLGNAFASASILSETTVEIRTDESLLPEQTTEEGNMVEKNPIEITETQMTEKNILIMEENDVASDTPGPEKAQKSKEDFNGNDYMDALFTVSRQNHSSFISDHLNAIKDKSLENTDNASLYAKEPLLDHNTQMVVVAPDSKDFPSSSNEHQVLCTEEILWEQIHAMRTIIGCRGVMRSPLVEELKALYIFTGIEPPDIFRDDTDLMDLAVNLQFLKAVIGIE